jgi:WD40 repeat protein
MTCSTCETSLPEAAAHCPHCGSPTPVYYSGARIAPNDPTLLSSPAAGAELPPPPLSGSSSSGLASSSPYGSLAYPTPYESSGGVPPPPPKRPVRRVSLIVGVALLVLLLSGGGVFAWLASSSARNKAETGPQAATTAQAHTSATAAAGVTGLPASSTAASTPSHLTYRGHTSDVHAVAWSPDGKLIASGGADSTVQVWSVG